MVLKIRRVVSGHDAQGRSTVLFDGYATNVKEMESMPGLALTDLWETDTSPVDNSSNDDAVARPVRLEPPPNGSIFRMVEFPPDGAWRDKTDVEKAFGSIGAPTAHQSASGDPLMHRTDTIDYLVVVKGEIYAILDTGEVLLRPGDVFVQRGTVHSWSVRGNEPCLLAAILINAHPV
ncbi:cupin domain-containing protein [Trinickia diaoshuihuensis]|jgi:mannose-6-phosphate isomerase-like protein (cupin superfamily)|uniref:cupin domain-containing protein n=1 Tax=Trinickia diaoshuihuensis TaxID=2292265 RepID=UPI000E28705F|nr:cupin domain-containing protein [Trinickia diaoshuihuensis]